MYELMLTLVHDLSLEGTVAEYLAWAATAVVVVLLAGLANLVAKRVLLTAIGIYARKSKNSWDDMLVNRHFFQRLSHLAPAIVIYSMAASFSDMQTWIERLAVTYMYIVGLAAINAFLSALVDIYRTYDIAKERPIKGYIQVMQIFLYVIVGVLVIANLLDRSPWGLLSGIGAMTAVLLLVFRDSILGLVASIQLSTNDMVRIGDWIEVPKYGADGDVIDVSLHTIKVQNWDKTITTIPAYGLISDSFKNWRGMNESGGRRIKRSVTLDMTSIRFCDDEMLARFNRMQLLQRYIEGKREELARHNKEFGADERSLVNGRHLTNIGTFRAYIIAYLRSHPKIHQQMTFLVRQMPPGPDGLPIEIYVFSNDQDWVRYEGIQADIFDHILAVAPEFDLRVFQHPTGWDLERLGAMKELR